MHLFVATPAYNEQLTTTYFRSFFALFHKFAQRGGTLTHRFREGSLIPLVRNELVADFLETNATHLLFWDADIGVAPEPIFDLLDFQKPVSGIACPLRQYDDQRKLSAFNFSLGNEYGPEWQPKHSGPFMRVPQLGTGLMLIERSVFPTMLKAIPEIRCTIRDREAASYFDTSIHPLTNDYRGEDYTFCDRWVVNCGGEVWCHVQAQVTHSGFHHFTGACKQG